MTPIVLVPNGRIAGPKLAQAVVHGGRIVAVDGTFDDCLRLARSLAADYPVALVNSLNPHRLAGQKTAAFEIVDDLGDAPDVHVLPVGNAGNISAYWMGYQEYAVDGPATRRPRMWGYQASGAAPIVRGEPVAEPVTVASAIRIGNPASWELAVAARDDSGGLIDEVTDEQILVAQQELSSREGLFVEPASAAGVAGLVAATASGRVDPGQVVVVTVTGHGLKDVDTASAAYGDVRPDVVPADAAAAASVLGFA
jgi:threonine synthase